MTELRDEIRQHLHIFLSTTREDIVEEKVAGIIKIIDQRCKAAVDEFRKKHPRTRKAKASDLTYEEKHGY